MSLRSSRIYRWGIAFAALAACSHVSAAPAAPALPSVAAVTLDGKPFRIDDAALRPAVINVWATWCPPCRNEMASLQQLSGRIKPDGISVVALSVDDDHNLVREFVLKYGIRIPTPIATVPRQALADLGIPALPVTLYVDADGRVVGRHIGQRDWADEAVAREIKQTFASTRQPRR